MGKKQKKNKKENTQPPRRCWFVVLLRGFNLYLESVEIDKNSFKNVSEIKDLDILKYICNFFSDDGFEVIDFYKIVGDDEVAERIRQSKIYNTSSKYWLTMMLDDNDKVKVKGFARTLRRIESENFKIKFNEANVAETTGLTVMATMGSQYGKLHEIIPVAKEIFDSADSYVCAELMKE